MTVDVIQQLDSYKNNDDFWTKIETVLNDFPSKKIKDADGIRDEIRHALGLVDSEMSVDEQDEILDEVHRTQGHRANAPKAHHRVSDIRQRLTTMQEQQGNGWPQVDHALLAQARAVNRQLELVKKVLANDDLDRHVKSQLINSFVHSVVKTRLPQSKWLWWSMGAFAFASSILIIWLVWLVMTDSVLFEGDVKSGTDVVAVVVGAIAVLATILSGFWFLGRMAKGPGRREGPNYSDSAISWWIATIAVLAAMAWIVGTMVVLPITDHSLRARENPNSGGKPDESVSSVCFDRMEEVGATKLTQDGQSLTAKGETNENDVPTVVTSAPSLTGGDSIRLEFGPYRLVTQLGQTTYTVGDESSQPITGQFVALPLGRGGSLHPRGLLVGHRQDGPVVTVFVCADPSQFRGNPTGSLSTTLIYQGEDAEITPATVSVSLQARYLWGLIPLIWLFSIFAVWLVLESWPRSARGLWLTILAVAIPTSVVFGGVLSNAGWTGNWRQLVTVVVAMYSAAVAAAATVKAGTSRGEGIATSDT